MGSVLWCSHLTAPMESGLNCELEHRNHVSGNACCHRSGGPVRGGGPPRRSSSVVRSLVDSRFPSHDGCAGRPGISAPIRQCRGALSPFSASRICCPIPIGGAADRPDLRGRDRSGKRAVAAEPLWRADEGPGQFGAEVLGSGERDHSRTSADGSGRRPGASRQDVRLGRNRVRGSTSEYGPVCRAGRGMGDHLAHPSRVPGECPDPRDAAERSTTRPTRASSRRCGPHGHPPSGARSAEARTCRGRSSPERAALHRHAPTGWCGRRPIRSVGGRR